MRNLLRSTTLVGLTCAAWALAAAPGGSHPLSATEKTELLPVICGEHLGAKGCTVCPRGSSNAGEADTLSATAVTYGHYLSARETDALVDLEGCEPHVTNFGASALLRWEGLTRWTLVKYIPGWRSGSCANLRHRDGRDRSVCEGYYANMGIEESSLSLIDWTRPDDAELLLNVDSNLESCFGSERHALLLKRWTVTPGGLSAQVSEARGTVPKNWQCGDTVKLPPAKTSALSWRWTGTSLLPSAATKMLLPRFQTQP